MLDCCWNVSTLEARSSTDNQLVPQQPSPLKAGWDSTVHFHHRCHAFRYLGERNYYKVLSLLFSRRSSALFSYIITPCTGSMNALLVYSRLVSCCSHSCNGWARCKQRMSKHHDITRGNDVLAYHRHHRDVFFFFFCFSSKTSDRPSTSGAARRRAFVP